MNTLRGCAQILLGEIPFDKAEVKTTEKAFCCYAARAFPQYSGDEIKNIYHMHVANKTVFEIIYDNAIEFLKYDNINFLPQLCCKEGQGLRWRSLFLKLGQDVFITALLAKQSLAYNNFDWKPVIDISAKGMLKEKFPENHFHLNGSTQVFHLNFVCLMNHIDGQHQIFKSLKQYYNGNVVLDTEGGKRYSLYEQCRIAAAIRLYLFAKVKYSVPDVFEDAFNTDILHLDASHTLELQWTINACHKEYSEGNTSLLDYAQAGLTELDASTGLAILAGERQLLYLCFRSVFDRTLQDKTHWTDLDSHYFYVYLILKNTFRRELVQTNGRLGFQNFSDYQDRKEFFIDKHPAYKKVAFQLAVNHTFRNENVSTLEARICPKKSAKKIRTVISYISAATRLSDAEECKSPFLPENFFFVFHFPKSKDKHNNRLGTPRDLKKRKEVHQQTRAIACLLASQNEWRTYIRGIDACSNEIGCRPEVFAPSFRYLMNVQLEQDLLGNVPPAPLNATFHVGEDFLDIADGLRAIDEVIFYMGFEKGCRLGHALALGIDAKEYYKTKKFQMIMPQQDLLDNLVWLIERARECKLAMSQTLFAYLNEQIVILAKHIYETENLDIATYYRAWKLRGDYPDNYAGNSYVEGSFMADIPTFSEHFQNNPRVSDSERLDANVFRWYHRYHFDQGVKERGAKQAVFSLQEEVRQDYIRLITDMQNLLLLEIKQKEIYIESNPSSNCLIGSFIRYENHPIFRFMKVGDTPDNSVCVSVNTDDLGVFDTSLQNEYALLATALIKKNQHSETEIKTYLNSLKEFGEKQVFH